MQVCRQTSYNSLSRGNFADSSIHITKRSKNIGIEISPEKPETMAYFVGKVAIRYKIIVDKKCLKCK
jgi:hypothetical protein